ncbi:glycyl-radical enzyme activating protein [Ruminococcus sp. OA3]|uniref:glycyl-radical enzyme activating protein n=1 Tax=Ruminococcus sp. OA3 TaxID=2914164 RepID=UPI001F057471|nr:glycyl-radical enzyme activating protein [Ruminococcus sp. OA3]MCH1981466.1 glycyl-radical enzyme activating protein [Ruminococcus sp. OA3]
MNEIRTYNQKDMACITDIQKFSVHDGPGIRSIVFFKGCPMRCKWCQNPETQSPNPELMISSDVCQGCGKCIGICPKGAIKLTERGLIYDRDQCIACGKCADLCGPEARKLVGKMMLFDEVLEMVLADRVFYKNTGGGLTVSGGEPTMQPEFVARLLKAVKAEGINTAMETCGMCSPEIFKKVIKDCDLLLYDVKHTDAQIHKKYTGFENKVILDNLQSAADQGKNIIIRIALIPGVNDTEENIKETVRLALWHRAKEIHVLPFHQMGQSKWHSLDKTYEYEEAVLPTQDVIDKAVNILECSGIPVNVGGHGEYKWLSV